MNAESGNCLHSDIDDDDDKDLTVQKMTEKVMMISGAETFA
jgi:hypothetical protein